jgi:3-hydroxyisobutyrate dehydrogenase-like beta-hydroxyacid dehydrogenase
MAIIGLLHPGQMGFAVGRTLQNSGHEVLWASEGRRKQTRDRASDAGFVDAGTVAALAKKCALIVSVCPPEFARQVADSVKTAGFRGLFADLNATSPDAKRAMATSDSFVDGGILGLPATQRNQTWIYLSGPRAREVAACFTEGPLEVIVLGDQVGQASALKMCYAGFNKGSIALAASVLAAAERNGVLDDLKNAWARKGLDSKLEQKILRAAPKSWRWAGEMREIASTLEAAGMPRGFHRAAEEVYTQLAGFKDAEQVELHEVLARLCDRQTSVPGASGPS